MSRYIDVYQVDAFTQTPFFGNPAGVVLDAQEINSAVRQKIAREMNCSETAFVTKLGDRKYQFRYFTPEVEVDLCGHATVATLHTLYEQTGLVGEISVDTNVGVLSMRIESDGTVWMQQAAPQFRTMEEDEKTAVLQALNVTPEDVDPSLPFALSFTGLWDIMIPFRDREIINKLAPNYDALAKVSKVLGAVSAHVYTMQPVEAGSAVHTRDFSPAVGINEDPHTGTANGALAALLVNRHVLEPGKYTFEQGWQIGRPGHIGVEVTPENQVYVGGRAVTVLNGRLRLA